LTFFRGLSVLTAIFFIVIEGDYSRGMGQGMPEYHPLGNFPRYFWGIDDSDLELLVGKNIGNSIGHIDARAISSSEGLEKTEARGGT
jgi:hypothetical protein